MKRIGKILATLAMVVTLILPLSCQDYCDAFDKVPAPIQAFDKEYLDLSESVVKIEVWGLAWGIYRDGEDSTKIALGTFMMAGSGFILQNRHTKELVAVTAAHVVDPTVVIIKTGTAVTHICPIVSVVDMHIAVGDSLIEGVPASVMYKNVETDQAVLRFNYGQQLLKTYFKPMEFQAVWTEGLEKGDALGTIVRKRDEQFDRGPWFECRRGYVVHPQVKVPAGIEYVLPWFNMNDVTTDLAVYPGDSGSPVIAWDKGKPVVVGIARAICRNPFTGEGYTYFTRIDFIVALLMGTM